MTEFISRLVGNDAWATLIMSIIPMIELKGGIVFARSAGFNFFAAFGLAYLGSTLVFVPIFFLLRPLLNLLKKVKWFNGFAIKVENYFNSKAEESLKKRKNKNKSGKFNENFLKIVGVFIFVAIPLPLTGVWTGTAVAVFLGLKFKEAILPVVVGNIVAGLIISFLAELCLALWTIAVLDYILYGLFGLAVVLLVFTIIKISLNKKKEISDTDGDK